MASAKTIQLNNIEAVTNALQITMRNDENVVLWGEDSGFEGGVFRSTQGLQAEFGKERVWDSPIAEATMAGTGVGAAIYGLRPVVEMQFQGFSMPSFQQMFVHAARFRNRTRGRFYVPMVLRMPMGGDVRALEHHSEAIEAIFAHIPGLKVVMPSNPYDTKGLLIAAIKDNDPVVFLEPKKLYRAFKQEVPSGEYEVEIGKAKVVKEGKTITVVTYGSQVHDSIQAIKELQSENPSIDVELVDLRTIKPIDTETIVNSVAKTGRLLVIHEAVSSFSVSSEVIARVNERVFLNLISPPARLTGYDITIPLTRGEKMFVVDKTKIKNKIKEVVGFAY